MSLAYYIVVERDLPDFDPFVNGKAVGHADETALAAIYEQLGVKDLMEFASSNREELAGFFEEVELPENLPEEEWFAASDGLATVRALRRHLQANPGDLDNSAAVLADLEEMETVLRRLDEEGVRWHLAIDY